MTPFISICIPAYKNKTYLDILLRSIEIQVYRDFEVIVSDDSPHDEVEILCREYAGKFPLLYHKNIPAKGSPGNWNVSIGIAKGKWIKTMHDDDWFANEQSLQKFADATKLDPSAGFIFSGFNYYENGQLKKVQIPGSSVEKKLKRSPLCLIAANHIGHPSTTLIRNDQIAWYDEETKWVVDFEFYIRCLNNTTFYMIREPLINIGINQEQITKASFGDRSIELPENMYLLHKMGTDILKNMIVYDHYWRLFRNLNIRSMEEVKEHCKQYVLPAEIEKMLKQQFKFPLLLLKQGVFSKSLMTVSYFLG